MTGEDKEDLVLLDFVCVEAEHLRIGLGVPDGQGTLTVNGSGWADCAAGLAEASHEWKAVPGTAHRSIRHAELGRLELLGDRPLLVLVVESELPLAGLYQLDLVQQGHRANVVHSALHALEVVTPAYDVVVTDLRLPDMPGEDFIQALRARPGCADLPVLVIAADQTLPAAIDDGATRLRRKPFDLEHFVSYVTEAAGMGRFRN